MKYRELNVWEEQHLEALKKQTNCKHEFTHVINKHWIGSEVVVYCKKCGAITVR